MGQNNLMELVNDCEAFKYASYDKELEHLIKVEEVRELGFTRLADNMQREITLKAKLAKIAEFKYLTITEEKINKFLQNKAEAYNKKHPKKKSDNHSMGFGGMYGPPIPPQFYRQMAQSQNYISSRNTLSISDDIQYGIAQLGNSNISQQMYLSPGNHVYLNQPQIFVPPTERFSADTNDRMETALDTIGRFEWTETPIDQYATLPPEDALKSLEINKSRQVFDYFTIASVNAVKDPLLLGRIVGKKERWFLAQWGEDVKIDDVV